jgi:AAA+ superfamily predicted ATPase
MPNASTPPADPSGDHQLPGKSRAALKKIAAAAQAPPVARGGPRRSLALLTGSSEAAAAAATLLAEEAGRPVFRVDLGTVLSKYLGETEKHLSTLFEDAGRTGAVLFFDEADSLFGRRSAPAARRDVSLTIGYLLGRLDACAGVVVMASRTAASAHPLLASRARWTIPLDGADRKRR